MILGRRTSSPINTVHQFEAVAMQKVQRFAMALKIDYDSSTSLRI